ARLRFAAAPVVPLRAGQSAASRQGVLREISFLQDVYAASPVFRNVNRQLVNGVPLETGQTTVSILDPSMYHTWLGRGDYRPISSDNFTVRYSPNDRLHENPISYPGLRHRQAR